MNVEKTYFYENIGEFIDAKYETTAVFEDSKDVLIFTKSLGMTTIGVESELNYKKLEGISDYTLRY